MIVKRSVNNNPNTNLENLKEETTGAFYTITNLDSVIEYYLYATLSTPSLN